MNKIIKIWWEIQEKDNFTNPPFDKWASDEKVIKAFIETFNHLCPSEKEHNNNTTRQTS